MTIAPDLRRIFRAFPGAAARPRHHLCRCASSSPAPAASSARCSCPGCAPTATLVRALGRDRARACARRCALRQVAARAASSAWRSVRARRAHRRRARARRSTGVEVAYYLIHSMETARRGARRRSPSASASRRENFAAAAAARGRAAHRLPRRPRAAGAATAGRRASRGLSRHLASREQVERILLDGGPRLGRAARLDRDRRALALVPPAGAPGRAHARARRCPRGGAFAPSRSTSAT